MIDLYYAPTPNGHKITLFLEEAELAYRLLKVDISKGNQFRPDFWLSLPIIKFLPSSITPRQTAVNRLVFLNPAKFFSTAEKSGKLLSGELRERHTTLQWLFWQVGGLGPMLGQNHHFNHFAPQAIPYAIERYQVETQRLYNVLNKRTETSPWLGGDHYSIADIASWPWVNAHQRQRIDLDSYPAVYNWFERIRTRPATARALLQAQLHCNSAKA